jgi:tRNA threonylcarbamoyladenosine biosynthesis protein TsaB
MLVLAIDTALNACSAALVRDGQTLASRVEPMARGQAERLAVLVDELVQEAGVTFGAIDAIAVTRGPGAFTGLRVGLAFARGLALALAQPCLGFSTLEVLAAGAAQPKIVAAISVAGSLFVGAWDGRREIIAPCRADIDDLLPKLIGDWAVTGPGAKSVHATRPDWLVVNQDVPDPVILAQLASVADPALHPPAPLYLRGVEAKLPGGILLPEADA